MIELCITVQSAGQRENHDHFNWEILRCYHTYIVRFDVSLQQAIAPKNYTICSLFAFGNI